MELTELKFANGLIPVIVQEVKDDTVLMMAFMNREALQRTIDTGEAWFWSRSRQQLWHKGETSGHHQIVHSIVADCDGDALLLKVEQQGPGACHEGYKSCFHYELNRDGDPVAVGEQTFDADYVYGAKGQDVFEELYDIISERRDLPGEGSYTAYLFREGIDKILKKVGEETAEVIIAAKNDTRQPLLEETADLLYHLTVLLAERGVTPRQVFKVLHDRRRKADTQSGRPEDSGEDAAANGDGSGAAGSDGSAGAANGANGGNGANGPNGPNGANGVTGADGTDASGTSGRKDGIS